MLYTIGLGKTGYAIVKNLAQHKQYKTFGIDTKKRKQKRYYCLQEQTNPQNYEMVPSLKTFFRGVKRKVLFIVDGGEAVSIATLAILEQISHCKIDILYVKPDIDLLSETQRKIERTIFNVLLEYTRSGMFEQIHIAHKPTIADILGDVPILEYENKINEAISSTYHMLNVFQNTKATRDNFSIPFETARISTMGYFDIEKNKEKLFYSLSEVRELDLYYNIKSETLKTDGEYYRNIMEQIKEKKDGKTKISFGIYESAYDVNNAYCIVRSDSTKQQ